MTENEIHIGGEYTDATIRTTDVDDNCIEQVTEIVNHEAFRNDIQIMPDGHAGAGAVIGFTMPLGERICPNTVGVDIGCGMTAYNMGSGVSVTNVLETPEDVDERIREVVPLGYETFSDVDVEQDYHIVNDFPWDSCEITAHQLEIQIDDVKIPVDYGKEYFMDLCERVEYDPKRAIDSLGTLGGGNHFIEISQSEQTGDYWIVVHSGSRGIGMAIAEYWQERAHENCDDRADEVRTRLQDVPEWAYRFDLDDVSDTDLLQWVQGCRIRGDESTSESVQVNREGGKGQDWKHTDEIRSRYEGEAIGELFDTLKEIGRYVHDNSGGDELDYLDGELRGQYLRDMIFAQTYARESRHEMCLNAIEAMGVTWVDFINSTHNYIDPEDAVIRKGATRVHEGERAVIPFNMRDGAVIVTGKGNDEWHNSAPHGAGRRGSRRWAYDTFEVDEFAEEMSDVYSTSVNEATLDEAPMAYKDHQSVLERMRETASVQETLTPVINIKAE